jgi:hypothetical protein
VLHAEKLLGSIRSECGGIRISGVPEDSGI